MKNELAAAWITSALADLKSIEHLKNDEFLTHIVAFHAQQCVEKCFKAFLEISTGDVPRIHSTLKLFAMVKDELKCELDTDLLTDLDALYIDARYPGDLGLLPDGKPTLENAHDFYDIAGKIFNLVNSRDMLL
jgi:HEPN domain-containing protein